jgi:hypothetical protein
MDQVGIGRITLRTHAQKNYTTGSVLPSGHH